MADGEFYPKPSAISVSEIAALTGAETLESAKLDGMITGVATLDDAGPGDICLLASPKYADSAATTRAGACFCGSNTAASLPATTIALIVADPRRALAIIQRRLYPSALRPLPVAISTGVAGTAHVSPEARLEEDVIVEAGVVVGARAEIGRGSLVGPNAVIGPSVKIGRNCVISAGVTVLHAHIGDNVIIHPGVHIGQDGFGYIPGEEHLKVPQIGRVVIQDNVEIGAATTIDRGGVRDTVIGEGTKIDNQVQIGHNVTIGRHCLIVAQVGISGSTSIGDYVVIGGQTGIAGHLKIGSGAQLGADSAVRRDVPANVKWAGKPARPVRDWLRAQSRALNPPRAGGQAGGFSEDSDG